MAYNTFTLTGTYKYFDGTAAAGSVEVIPSVKTVKDTGGNVILAGRVADTLEPGVGTFSITLPDPNDTDLQPSNFGYTVVVKLNASRTRIPTVTFDASQVTGPTLDMEDITPVDISVITPTVQYATHGDVTSGDAATLAAAEAYTDAHAGTGAVASVAGKTGAVTLVKGDVGLGSVNNTADVDKPVSTAQAAAIAAKADLAPAMAPARLVFPKPRDTVISTFQSGHGWTKSGTGTMTDDTSDYALGTQAVKLVTAGDGASNYIKSGTLALDLSNQALVLVLKIDDFTHYSDLQIRLSSNGFTDYAYCKPAYTGLTQRWVEPGTWTTITLSRAEIVAGMSWGNGGWQYIGTPSNVNWANITGIWLKAVDDATGNPVTFRVNLLSYFPKPTRSLLSIVFDDSRATHYSVAKAYLDRYRLPATFATIFENLGTSGYMTLAQMQQMRDQSKHSFICHADSNVAGVLAHQNGYDGLTYADGLSDALSLKQKMNLNGFTGANLIAYPHGSWSINAPGISSPNTDVLNMMRRLFDVGRTTNSNTLETYPPADSHKLRSYTVGNTDTAAQLLAVLDAGIAAGAWTIMQFHNLTSPATNASDCTPAVFQAFIDGVATRVASGLVVKTLHETLMTGAA